MARALASHIVEITPQDETIVITLAVAYFGTDIAADASRVTFTIGATDTLTQMRDKAVDAVMTEGARLGYAMAKNRCVVPSLVRGS